MTTQVRKRTVKVFYEKLGEEYTITGGLATTLVKAQQDGYLTIDKDWLDKLVHIPWSRVTRIEEL